jgi:hypothetical protein
LASISSSEAPEVPEVSFGLVAMSHRSKGVPESVQLQVAEARKVNNFGLLDLGGNAELRIRANPKKKIS